MCYINPHTHSLVHAEAAGKPECRVCKGNGVVASQAVSIVIVIIFVIIISVSGPAEIQARQLVWQPRRHRLCE